MCTVAKNDKYNSYELKFDGKPSQEIRDLLKASGYRWNKAKGIWYGYADISAKLNAEQTKQPTEQKTEGKEEQRADREEQAKLLAEYLELIRAQVWKDEKMLDFIRKDTARIVKTENGDYLVIEKPRIETRFCFGYGCQGAFDTQEEAEETRAAISKDAEYFKEKNRADLLETIERLNSPEDWYLRVKYWKSPEDSKIKEFVHIPSFHWLYKMSETQRQSYKPMNAADVATLKRAHEIVLAEFDKRLNAYLKRYGTSKLHTWTYWADA